MAKIHLTVGFFVLIQAALVKSQVYNCKDHDIKPSDEDLAKLKKCGEAIGIKTMEEMTPDKMPCFAKCIIESAGLVDENGQPHKENIMKNIDEKMDPKVKDLYKDGIGKCLDEHGKNINPKDLTCMTYSPLVQCAAKAMKEICKG